MSGRIDFSYGFFACYGAADFFDSSLLDQQVASELFPFIYDQGILDDVMVHVGISANLLKLNPTAGAGVG
jgi:hypothetical protein